MRGRGKPIGNSKLEVGNFLYEEMKQLPISNFQ
jgi:hypothetical protein